MNIPGFEGLSEAYKEAMKSPFMQLYYATPEPERWKLSFLSYVDQDVYYIHKYSAEGDVYWTRVHYHHLLNAIHAMRERGHPHDAVGFLQAKLDDYRRRGIFKITNKSIDTALRIGDHAEEPFKPKPTTY